MRTEMTKLGDESYHPQFAKLGDAPSAQDLQFCRIIKWTVFLYTPAVYD